MVVNSSINVEGTSNKTLNHLVRRSARSSQGMRFSAAESLPVLEFGTRENRENEARTIVAKVPISDS